MHAAGLVVFPARDQLVQRLDVFLGQAAGEAGTDKATQLMEIVINGAQPVLQPTHQLAEVGAVARTRKPVDCGG
jgi:hypothetical protein